MANKDGFATYQKRSAPRGISPKRITFLGASLGVSIKKPKDEPNGLRTHQRFEILDEDGKPLGTVKSERLRFTEAELTAAIIKLTSG